MMDVEIPDWVREGERVAVEESSSGSFSQNMGYTMDVVDRLTPTQIVLTSGRRFKASSLVELGGRGRLVSRHDEKVKNWRIRQEIQRYAMKIKDIAGQLRNGRRFTNDDALNQMGVAQRQMEKAIYRITEDKLS